MPARVEPASASNSGIASCALRSISALDSPGSALKRWIRILSSSTDAAMRRFAARSAAAWASASTARACVKSLSSTSTSPYSGSSTSRVGSCSPSSATARRYRLAAACESPRAKARLPGCGQAPRAVGADRDALLVERPEFAQVAVRLLEVVAEDLLELERAVAVGVDAVGPAHEVDVQLRARALEQAVVDGVAHQLVVEAVARARRRRSSTGGRTACASASPGARRARAHGLGRQFEQRRAAGTPGRSPTPVRRWRVRRGPAGRAAPRAARGWSAARRCRPRPRRAPSARRPGSSAPRSISIDSICSTYSGLPSAVSTMRATTSCGSPVPPSRLATTCSAASSLSGRSTSREAPGCSPHCGRSSSRSWRAVASSRIGASLRGRQHVLEQIEERRLGPVDVVDQRHHRRAAPPGSRAPCARPSRSRAADRSTALRPMAAATRSTTSRSPRNASSLACAVSGLSSSRMSAALEHHAQRPERDAVAIGQAAAAQHGGAGGDARHHLVHQARLADAGVADHGDHAHRSGPRPPRGTRA